MRLRKGTIVACCLTVAFLGAGIAAAHVGNGLLESFVCGINAPAASQCTTGSHTRTEDVAFHFGATNDYFGKGTQVFTWSSGGSAASCLFAGAVIPFTCSGSLPPVGVEFAHTCVSEGYVKFLPPRGALECWIVHD
jgi:hypothetical protein